MKNTKLHKIYDIIFGALACMAAVLVFIDSSENLSTTLHRLFLIIYLVFAVDFTVRLIRADNKRRFLIHNVWDVIALLPIHGIFPAPSNHTLDVILSLLGIIRAVAFLSRPLRKLKPFYNTNGFKYVVFASLMTIITGGILIHYAEHMDMDDGIWWAFVTATTVGYGDISPSTIYGRLIASVLMIVGIGLIGSLTSTLTSFFMERQKKGIKNSMIDSVKSELDRFDELTVEEVDDICRILKSMKTK